LQPENKAQLVDILTYHVLPEQVLSTDLKNFQRVKTVQGQNVNVYKGSYGVQLCDKCDGKDFKRVTAADNAASNGVVHIIDGVLIPPAAPAPTPAPTPAAKNIVDLAEGNADLSTLVAALVGGDLVSTLSSPGPFTVFAPTNTAFAGLPAGTLDNLMKPANKAQLVDILTYHVVSGNILSTDLKSFQAVTTVEGKSLHVVSWGGEVQLGPSLQSLSKVIAADNKASNGVVHIINGVLLPPAGVPAGKAKIVVTETSAPSAYKTCSDDTVKSSFQVNQDSCYGLAGVNTSAVNVDQSVHCNADGSFVLSQYKTTDGSCTGSRYPDRIQLLYRKGQCLANTAAGSYQAATVICPEAPTQNIVELADDFVLV